MTISYPITNHTKKTLYFDTDRILRGIHIHEENPDGLDIVIEPDETIVLEFGIECEGFRVKDKEGYIV